MHFTKRAKLVETNLNRCTLDVDSDGLKCSPGEILANSCLDHVICPLYNEIVQISRSKGLGFWHMLLLEIGLD